VVLVVLKTGFWVITCRPSDLNAPLLTSQSKQNAFQCVSGGGTPLFAEAGGWWVFAGWLVGCHRCKHCDMHTPHTSFALTQIAEQVCHGHGEVGCSV